MVKFLVKSLQIDEPRLARFKLNFFAHFRQGHSRVKSTDVFAHIEVIKNKFTYLYLPTLDRRRD